MVASINNKLGATKAALEQHSPASAQGRVSDAARVSASRDDVSMAPSAEKAKFGHLAVRTDLTAETARATAVEARDELSISGRAIANSSSQSVLALLA